MNATAIPTLPASASVADVCTELGSFGAVIVENMYSDALIDRSLHEIEPFLAACDFAGDDFLGKRTRRVSGLLGKCPSSAELIVHPLFLGAARELLTDVTPLGHGDSRIEVTSSITLSVTQAIDIWPGNAAQPLHRDDLVHHNRHPGPDTQLQIMCALTDFTADNGATRAIPGSHQWDDEAVPADHAAVPAVMLRGSGLLFLGSLYHGGGANTSTGRRTALTFSYCKGYLRQEENQYLAVPVDVARQYSEEVQRLIGYDYCPPACGMYELGDAHAVFDR